MENSTSNMLLSMNKKTKIYLIVLAVFILVAAGGIFWYKLHQAALKEAEKQKMISEIAQAASKVNLSNTEKLKMVQDLAKSGTFKFPPKEAAKQEAEIISRLNSR